MRQYGSKIKAFTYVPLQVGAMGSKGVCRISNTQRKDPQTGNFAQENNTRSAGSPTESNLNLVYSLINLILIFQSLD